MKNLSVAVIFLNAVLLLSILVVSTPPVSAQGARVTRSRVVEPNRYAADLYSSKLQIKLTLVNLPGANDKRSYWEVSYNVYFVPEAEYQKAIEQVAVKGIELDPSHFPTKILLSSRTFKRTALADLPGRTFVQNGVTFKSRVRDAARTKFARLVTSYTTKIFDAALNKTFYRSGVFFTYPFDDAPEDAKRAIPRTTLYTNFFVSPEGKLYESLWPRTSDSTTW